MVPNNANKGYAVAFLLINDGSLKKLWRVEGYSFEAYLSKGGHYFIRIGPWVFGRKPSKEDIAVEFFKNGFLLRAYSSKDLIKDISKLVATSGHYFWRQKIIHIRHYLLIIFI